MDTYFSTEGRLKRTFPRYNGQSIKKMIKERTITSAYVNSVSDSGDVSIKIGKNVDGYIKCDQFVNNIGDVKRDGHSASYMRGKMISVVITDIKGKDNNSFYVEASRRAAQSICKSIKLDKLLPGDIMDVDILSASDKGIFCDLGCGVISIMSVKDYSVGKMLYPKEQLKGIRNLRVVVKRNNITDGISVSHKELLGTWEENIEGIKKGDKLFGQVIQSNEKGIFVKVKDNLYGLADANEDIKLGSSVIATVGNIVVDKMKFKISDVEYFKETFDYKPTVYTIPESVSHINEWLYSPKNCDKVIRTVFGTEESVYD